MWRSYPTLPYDSTRYLCEPGGPPRRALVCCSGEVMAATTASPPRLARLLSGNRSMPAAPAARPTQRLISLRLKLGMLLGTVAALAVAIPTILHALTFVADQERKVGEDNLELARVVGGLTAWRIEQTFVLLDVLTT